MPAGGEEREGAGKVYPPHGEMPRNLAGASDRILSGENEQGQLPWRWHKERLTQHLPPPPCLFLETFPLGAGQGSKSPSLNTLSPLPCTFLVHQPFFQ